MEQSLKENGKQQVVRFLSSTLLLVANVLVLFCIVAVLMKNELNKNLLSLPLIDQGWATLVGSLIGFGAIGWQIRSSIASQTVSQEKQAKLDRDAKQFESELAAKQRSDERNLEARALSSALRGELVAAHQFAFNLGQGANLNKELFGQMAKGVDHHFDLISVPPFEAVIYNTSISKLHLLSVSMIADLVQIHALIKGLTFKANAKAHANFLAATYQIQATSAEAAKADIFHVAMRLRAFEFGEADPGSLAEVRAKKPEPSKQN